MLPVRPCRKPCPNSRFSARIVRAVKRLVKVTAVPHSSRMPTYYREEGRDSLVVCLGRVSCRTSHNIHESQPSISWEPVCRCLTHQPVICYHDCRIVDSISTILTDGRLGQSAATARAGIHAQSQRPSFWRTSPTNTVGDVQTALSEGSQVLVDPVDEALFRLRWPQDAEDWALLEVENQRYPVIYTAIKSDIANRRIDQLVNGSAILDRTWLSPSMFQQLWSLVERTFPRHRFSRIVFEHESVYQRLDEAPLEQNEEDDDLDDEMRQDVRRHQPDRRSARVQITERIGEMQDAVLPWEKRYEPTGVHRSVAHPSPRPGRIRHLLRRALHEPWRLDHRTPANGSPRYGKV